jgi:hypothetical protein
MFGIHFRRLRRTVLRTLIRMFPNTVHSVLSITRKMQRQNLTGGPTFCIDSSIP